MPAVRVTVVVVLRSGRVRGVMLMSLPLQSSLRSRHRICLPIVAWDVPLAARQQQQQQRRVRQGNDASVGTSLALMLAGLEVRMMKSKRSAQRVGEVLVGVALGVLLRLRYLAGHGPRMGWEPEDRLGLRRV